MGIVLSSSKKVEGSKPVITRSAMEASLNIIRQQKLKKMEQMLLVAKIMRKLEKKKKMLDTHLAFNKDYQHILSCRLAHLEGLLPGSDAAGPPKNHTDQI